ncbi:hypothetical protein F4680DRAFT_297656 [Xylaria scruposa]|nr:hypothetical protein F4680DRAFT_297656 [Xylaria scruposa]
MAHDLMHDSPLDTLRPTSNKQNSERPVAWLFSSRRHSDRENTRFFHYNNQAFGIDHPLPPTPKILLVHVKLCFEHSGLYSSKHLHKNIVSRQSPISEPGLTCDISQEMCTSKFIKYTCNCKKEMEFIQCDERRGTNTKCSPPNKEWEKDADNYCPRHLVKRDAQVKYMNEYGEEIVEE